MDAELGDAPGNEHLNALSRSASEETPLQDPSGTMTSLIPEWSTDALAPPVGLNWRTVADGLGIDERVLRHEGSIVPRGDNFPEAGFFFDPVSLHAQLVRVGDVASCHGYFLGNLTARDFSNRLRMVESEPHTGLSVVRSPRGPVIGLFSSERQAMRAKRAIQQGAVGGGIAFETGPLGIELTVERPDGAGMVATLIAGHGGAVIAIGGVSTSRPSGLDGRSTVPSARATAGDGFPGGTGVAASTGRPLPQSGGPEEFTPL